MSIEDKPRAATERFQYSLPTGFQFDHLYHTTVA